VIDFSVLAERQNLCTQMERLTRLTNVFSKKFDMHRLRVSAGPHKKSDEEISN